VSGRKIVYRFTFNGALSAGVKWPWCEADHSRPFSAEVKNGGAILPLSIHLNGVVLN
jgi:hypothetical protein